MTTDTSKFTFLGMPGYGKQTAAAGRSLWRARANMENVAVSYRQGSLLAANFNGLWCDALNVVHRGGKVDYFAMLHDDIGAPDGWLDTLIGELESNDLDIIGVVVPIKDHKGLTSVAVDNQDGYTWRPKCRLTMTEALSLPPTFKSEHVGGNLLLNTGCWVCKFDESWVRKVRFTINDRIVFNSQQNRYEAEVEPEDWYFSRLLHELGLKIGATTKIRIDHRGEIDFSNSHAWGQPFDASYVTKSTIVEPFPVEIRGWLNPAEGRALADLSRGKRVLEIGSYCGKSTVCIARTAESVVAVDYFDGRATPDPVDTSGEFWANMTRYGVADKITVAHPDGVLPNPKFDFAFIDGDHSRESVDADISKVINSLNPGGLIAFHDYKYEGGVTEAVNEMIANGSELVSEVGTLAVVRPSMLVLN